MFSKECVLEVANNSKLKGEFRFLENNFQFWVSWIVMCPGWPWIWWRAMLWMTLNPGALHMHCKFEKPGLNLSIFVSVTILILSQHVYFRSEPSFTKRVRDKQKSKVGQARDYLLRFGFTGSRLYHWLLSLQRVRSQVTGEQSVIHLRFWENDIDLVIIIISTGWVLVI